MEERAVTIYPGDGEPPIWLPPGETRMHEKDRQRLNRALAKRRAELNAMEPMGFKAYQIWRRAMVHQAARRMESPPGTPEWEDLSDIEREAWAAVQEELAPTEAQVVAEQEAPASRGDVDE